MPQKYTDARKNGNRKWDAANLDRMSIALPKGQKDAIKAAAVAAGMSTNAYIGKILSGEMLPPYCVRYTLTEDQQKQLDELAAEYSRKLNPISPAELFDMMMFHGSRQDISDKLTAYRSMLERTKEQED